MYTRYYDTYPAAPVTTGEEKPSESPEPTTENKENMPSEPVANLESARMPRLFGGMKSDDILLIALLLITISDSNDDFLMPLILGALLLG